MTNSEMLLQLLQKSGWQPTTETDEDGRVICKADDESEA